ncbi:MAG: hypothetical protein K0R75_3694 [Paenibacillaceae bacterium]|jgi:hypothetical protein|nr:hypothetical protein [Paenibacillaceae bacterium]
MSMRPLNAGWTIRRLTGRYERRLDADSACSLDVRSLWGSLRKAPRLQPSLPNEPTVPVHLLAPRRVRSVSPSGYYHMRLSLHRLSASVKQNYCSFIAFALMNSSFKYLESPWVLSRHRYHLGQIIAQNSGPLPEWVCAAPTSLP